MDVLMPQMGETVAEGTLTIWHKKVGETVKSSDILFEIGTDKVEMEVPALANGVLREILVQAGETVAVGAKLGVIEDSISSTSDSVPIQDDVVIDNSAKVPLKNISKRDRSMKLSPVVRKLLSDHSLNHSDIEGTGREGRIKRGDVLNYIKNKTYHSFKENNELIFENIYSHFFCQNIYNKQGAN